MADFADHAALAAGWRELTATEVVNATMLLGVASRQIRRWRPDIADDDPDAIAVVICVVRDAIATGRWSGHTSYTRTMGPRTVSGTLAAAAGSLVWADWMKEALGVPLTAQPRWVFGDTDPSLTC